MHTGSQTGTKCFTRHQRLLKSEELQRVFATGRRSADSCFTVLAAVRDDVDSQEEQQHRLGLAISKKAAPRAVDRNRIKRIVRESFRLINIRWRNRSIDFIVMTTRSATQKDNPILFDSLHRHWQKLWSDSHQH
ncbi:ribonuclease P protein component [Thiorhodovibrio winogradskyi]|uniref:ribonuclease P protein component n=1 Tax=Thiorhodovibrio winogradskyi TaxID=77007 RepID=UPI002E2AC597|nr:ribonuclease P protein component [Thiorhodovibrio winogradskyi]